MLSTMNDFEKYCQIIGSGIKQRRHLMGMTQAQLAQRLKKHRRDVIALERGKNITLKTLFKLLTVLDLDYHDLLPTLPHKKRSGE